jgi:hypothetical protein
LNGVFMLAYQEFGGEIKYEKIYNNNLGNFCIIIKNGEEEDVLLLLDSIANVINRVIKHNPQPISSERCQDLIWPLEKKGKLIKRKNEPIKKKQRT